MFFACTLVRNTAEVPALVLVSSLNSPNSPDAPDTPDTTDEKATLQAALAHLITEREGAQTRATQTQLTIAQDEDRRTRSAGRR